MRSGSQVALASAALAGLICLPFFLDRIATNYDNRKALADRGHAARLIAAGSFQEAEGLLRRVDRSELSTTERILMAYQDAVCSRMLERPMQAYERLDRLQGLLPPLRDYREFWMAHALEMMGETEAAADAYEDLLVTFRQEALADSAYMRLLALYTETGDFSRAIGVCRRLGQLRPERRPELGFRMAQIYTKLGNQAGARQALRKIVVEHPAHPRALEALELLPAPTQAADLQAWGTVYLRQGRFARAAGTLRRFLARFPSHPEAGEVTFQLADAYRGNRQYAEARDYFRRSYDDYGIPQALYRLGGILVRLDREDGAIDSYRRLAHRLPGHPLADDALWQAAKAAERGNRFELAAELYAQLAGQYPQSEMRDEADWSVGFAHYCRDRFEEALAHFEAVSRRAREPHIVDQSLFWAGKAAGELGLDETSTDYYREAARSFPRSYYSSRATEQGYGEGAGLLAWMGADIDGREPHVALVNTRRQARPAATGLLAEARLLGRIGLVQLARSHLRRAEGNAGDDLELLREIRDRYVGISAHDQALRLSSVIYARDADGREFPHLYPSFYWEQVERAAREAGIAPYLVLSVIRQESSFREDAVSRAGAIGLMQIMPKTGRLLARKIGLRRFRSASLFDPHVSIRLGSRFLGDQVQRFASGPTAKLGFELGLAAYNAGPRAATAWTKRFSYADPDTFVERIPYRETRKYVKLVLKNYAIYKALSEARSV